MDVFEKLKNGEPVDMMSEEYRPAITELHRADKALFHLNHTGFGDACFFHGGTNRMSD